MTKVIEKGDKHWKPLEIGEEQTSYLVTFYVIIKSYFDS